MAVRDIVVLNTTASRLEAQQSSDTVRIKGTSTELLSIENSSGTSIFSINAPSSSITITGNLTASGDFSSSLASTASFGKIEATTVVGSAAGLTSAEAGTGIVSSSVQMAANISGSFQKGFEFTGTIGKAVGVWSAGGNMINARGGYQGAGTVNAALAIGSWSPNKDNTEEYNGSAWSEGGAIITTGAAGTAGGAITAAILAGRSPSRACTELYDGTAWSETTDLITGRLTLASGGTQNSFVVFGGMPHTTLTEEWDGSSWTAGGARITAIGHGMGTGTQNAALAVGGYTPSIVSCTEEYNGSSWAAGGALTIARYGGTATGTQNAGMVAAGYFAPARSTCTEEYNGTSWSVGGTGMRTGTSETLGAGSQDSSMVMGGYGGSPAAYQNTSDHYDGYLPVSASFGKLVATSISGDAKYLTNTTIPGTVSSSAQIASDISGSFTSGFSFTGTIGTTPGTWAAGGALMIGGDNGGGAGIQNAALYFGTPSVTQHYNGSAWSMGGTLNVSRTRMKFGAGTEYAALAAGHWTAETCTEEYYGETWAVGGALGTGRAYMAGAGTQNAALAIGGAPGTDSHMCATEHYDGSTWSAGGTLNHGRGKGVGAGTQNATLFATGYGAPFPYPIASCTETYDGSTWTVESGTNTARQHAMGGGLQNIAFIAGGEAPSSTSNTEEWNGISWSEVNNLITARARGGGAGTKTNGVIFGGASPNDTCTEEYTSYITSASFGTLCAIELFGNASKLTNKNPANIVSSSAQIASDISGSFQSGFGFGSFVSGSGWVTGSIGTTVGAWAAGGVLPTARGYLGGAGIQNAYLAIGGSPTQGETLHYNGSSWSVGGVSTISGYFLGTAGTEYAALAFGGDQHCTNTEEYYGQTWAVGGTMITARAQNFAALGLQNAALAAGGREGEGSDDLTCTEEYNGSAWAVGGALNAARQGVRGVGTQNAGLAMGGLQVCTCTEEYDGSAWATSNPLALGRKHVSAGGTQNAAFAAGGREPSAAGAGTACNEHYNGTTWSAGSSLSNSRYGGAGGGTLTAGIVTGGYGGSPAANCTLTEEYTSYITSASFGTLKVASVAGSAARLSNFKPANLLSGSSAGPIASQISASFRCGFEFTGNIGRAHGVWTQVDSVINSYAGSSGAGFGLQNAAVIAGSHVGAASSRVEVYNGLAWSAAASLGTGRNYLAGAGYYAAGLAMGGNHSGCTERFDGTAWTEVADLTVPRYKLSGTGNDTAAVVMGGFSGSAAWTTSTEEYDGSSWTAGGAMITGRLASMAGGTQNAAVAFGGDAPTAQGLTEEYDGSTWATANRMNCVRASGGGTGTSQNDVLTWGAYGNICTEEYNGTSWAHSGAYPDPSGQFDPASGLGHGPAALSVNGRNAVNWHGDVFAYEGYMPISASFGRIVATNFQGDASNLTNTAITGTVSSSAQIASDISGSFTSGFAFTNTAGIRVGVWSAGGTLIAARGGAGGFGVRNAAVYAGGTTPSVVGTVEEYNGVVWSAGGALILSRYELSGAGTLTAGLVAGGVPGPKDETELYDGIAWSEVADLITARQEHAGGGTQNAAIMAAGQTPTAVTCTEEWDGSSWSAGGAVPIAGYQFAGGKAGTVNAFIMSNGYPNNCNSTYKYDGSAWTTHAPTNVGTRAAGGAGTQNAFVKMGGYSPAQDSGCTEEYNGSVWTVGNKMIVGASETEGIGTSNASILNNGYVPPAYRNTTEEYTGYIASASFGKISATTFSGDGSGLTNSKPASYISSSAQIASDISGSFTSGFADFSGNIVGAEGVWSSRASQIVGRLAVGAFGTQNDSVVFGGKDASGNLKNCTEEYNGTSWSETGALPTLVCYTGGAGSQNAGMHAGNGGPAPVYDATTLVQKYNGSTWTAGASLGKAGTYIPLFGTQNAALAIARYGGMSAPTNVIYNCTEEYDGTQWSERAHMVCPRMWGQGAGTVNAGLAIGGSPSTSLTEEYDGSSWAMGPALVHSFNRAGGSSGTQNAALAFVSGKSQFYDGTAWAAKAKPTFSSYDGDGDGSSGHGAWWAGGYHGAQDNENGVYTAGGAWGCSEEYVSYEPKVELTVGHLTTVSASIDGVSGWTTNYFESGSTFYSASIYGTMLSGSSEVRNKLRTDGKRNINKLVVNRSFQVPIFEANPVTASAGELWYSAPDKALKFSYSYNTWSVGGALIISRTEHGGAGTQNAGLVHGGLTPSETDCTEEYNGTAWSDAGAAMIDGRCSLESAGAQNAAIAMGGADVDNKNCTELYNGSSWSAGALLITGRRCMAAIGTTNAAMAAGGVAPGNSSTELYNGQSWTAAANLITGAMSRKGAGAVNAALVFGGHTNCTCTEHFNGSAWSAGGALISGTHYSGGAGTENAALSMGGNGSPTFARTEEYNGVTWSAAQLMIAGRDSLAGMGNQSTALVGGGRPTPAAHSTCTEEYSENVIKTVSLSS